VIIIDFNGIAIGNIVSQKLEADENLLRHTILNTIRMYNLKYRDQYGQMYIACDGGSWRRGYFEQYKYKRREARKDDTKGPDWDAIFEILNKVLEEIKTTFPYVVVQMKGAEADDIIARLVASTQEFGQYEDVMIVSADKDFIQLQVNGNVKQYSPITKKMVSEKNPELYLYEHIFKGDSGDGIPNFLSPDDCFVTGTRQKPVTKKRIESLLDNLHDLTSVMSDEEYRNFVRNKTLIDLNSIPSDVKFAIDDAIEEAKNVVPKNKSKVLNYLVKNKCKLLIESIDEF
jgi:5'-3' exonuclease